MIQSKRSILSPSATGLGGARKSCLLPTILLTAVFLLAGCGKEPESDTTAELAASFEGSPALDDVVKAAAAFEEGRYKDSLKLLYAVVGRTDLTERQERAIAGLVGRLLEAIHEDPQLSQDIQLHRMMELLVRRTLGET